MTKEPALQPETFFDALVSALQAAASYNRADQAAPVAVLWPDKERQWEALLPRLRTHLPLLTLGAYDPATQTGPAIWLRCMIARTLPENPLPENLTPILYLPGVSKQELRAVEDCPRSMQPLAELQYRGALWLQRNGKDWTISAFLQSADGGLGIEVTADTATREAVLRALTKLAEEPVAVLRADAPLNAARFNALLDPDSARNLLLWLNTPAARRAASDDAAWSAFCANCRQQFGLDPDTDGEITAASRMGQREGAWQVVWDRFAEAPRRYPNLPELLRRARPANPDGLFHESASWPQDNATEEEALRQALAALQNTLPAEARQTIRALEATHGKRRGWVWAELGQSPLACALPALLSLAERTETALSGAAPQEIAAAYVQGGWRADASVLDALAAVETQEDAAAMKSAIHALYRPWLQEQAERFQQAVSVHGLSVTGKEDHGIRSQVPPQSGRCLVFADGLRYDVGQKLAQALEEKGLSTQTDWMFAALPGVTSTAKPAVSPAASRLGSGPDLSVTAQSDRAKAGAEILRREISAMGYTVLSGDETGDPSGAAWTEAGSLDAYGHAQGWKLARRVREEVHALSERIQGLLNAGWQDVQVITDHGWLLVPGGLPKVELPEHLAEIRKGRCARLKASAQTNLQTVSWHWDAEVRIAVAPGIGCFTAGKEYEHGGLSPQECVVPVLTVKAARLVPTVALTGIKWVGLRCQVQTTGTSEGCLADIRTRPADAATSLLDAPKPVKTDGTVSLAVADDSREGEAVVIVIIGRDGRTTAQAPTLVGG